MSRKKPDVALQVILQQLKIKLLLKQILNLKSFSKTEIETQEQWDLMLSKEGLIGKKNFT